MKIEQIEALVELVTNSGVTEVTVRTPERRITVRRNPSPAAQAPSTATRASAELALRDEQNALTAPSQAGAPAESPASLTWITAPMVGVFHHAEPPVTVGSEVEPGAIVGVIESMKLMNDVRAEAGGIVIESAIEAGMAAEFGQPLFGLRGEENG